MRISDWSSDVCSSDLLSEDCDKLSSARGVPTSRLYLKSCLFIDATFRWCSSSRPMYSSAGNKSKQVRRTPFVPPGPQPPNWNAYWSEIGRASGRERECKYVYISVVDVSLKKKNKKNKTQ